MEFIQIVRQYTAFQDGTTDHEECLYNNEGVMGIVFQNTFHEQTQ